MRKILIGILLLAVILIPSSFVLTDIDSSDAVLTTSVTPTGSTTTATLTFVSSGIQSNQPATNWRLDVTAYEDSTFGATGIINAMHVIATDNNYYPNYFNSLGMYKWYNNDDMVNDGIAIASATPDIVLMCPDGFSTPGTYTYTNTIDTNSTSNQIGTQGSNQQQMLNYITVVVTIIQTPTKTLTYDTNGGSFSSTPTTITYPTGTVVTLATDISKPGYNFTGWEYNGNIVSQVTMDNNTTVAATWTPANYTVTFNANGGTTPTASKTVTYGQQYGTLPTPTRAGDYFFIGWYTESSGGSVVTSSTTYTLTTNQTLYAHWGQSTMAVTPTGSTTTATLTFVSTGTFSNSPATNWRLNITAYKEEEFGAEIPLSVMQTISAYYNNYPTYYNSLGMYSWHNNTDMVNNGIAISGQEGKLVMICPNGMSPTGTYTFTNSYSSNGTSDQIGTQASNSPAYQMLNYITVVVTIQNRSTYNLTYDTNGGSFSSTPTTITYPTGTVVTLATDISKPGYNFTGWDYGGLIETQITILRDTTVAATWTPANYTVTFNANGGTTPTASKTVTYGQQYGTLPTPTRAGDYFFIGWYTESSGGSVVTSSTTYTLTTNQTLYAHWGQSTMAVTPTGSTTTATLTFVSTGTFSNSPATNWRLEITGYEDTILGAEIPLSVMETLATYYNYYPTHFNSIGMYSWHNNTNMANDGIAIVGQSGKITVVCNNVFGTPATYTYNNRININSSSDQIGTQASNSPAYQMLNYITIVFNVMVEPNKDITYDTNGGIFATTPTTTYPTGTVVTLPTDITKTGYEFSGWLYNNEIVQQITLSDDVTVVAQWTPNEYEVTFDANEGTVNPDTMTVTYNEDYGPMPTPTRAGYTFKGWYTQAVDGNLVVSGDTYLLTTNQTLYAHWTENVAYWSNGNPNGSISILYKIDNTNVTNDLITNARLLRFNPTITDDPSTQYNESFVDSGYYVQIEILSTKVGTSYDAQAIARLYDSNDNLIAQGYNDFGSWAAFIITIDTINANVTYTKVMQFRTFTDYQESVSGPILSYGDDSTYAGMSVYELKITPVSETAPRQSIVNTSVFLNTYGVVLTDPSIDIAQYFPEMDEARLNFYSFALYGQTMTVNGHTMNVIAPNITVNYKPQSGSTMMVIQDAPGDNITTRTLELTNIYVTWTATHCYLTFVNDNLTIDMGTYTDKTVSFGGIWYFSTALYDPYTTTETTYEMDWWHANFNMADFGMVMAIILIMLALISKATIGGRTIDYVIVGFGVIVALIIAGGVINA